MKVCTKCKIEKPKTEFHKKTISKDGYRNQCKKCILLKNKEWVAKNPDKVKEIQRKAKTKKRETEEGRKKLYEINKKYTDSNRDKVNSYYKNKSKEDKIFHAAKLMRSMLHRVLKRTNQRKDARCCDILGYTGQQLKYHLEKQFTKGMRWDLFGSEIHIDHIISVDEYVKSGEIRPEVINALTNLRPMWSKENIIKSNKKQFLL